MDEGNIVIMKRIILLTSMILCALSLHAQDASDYRPFIEEGKVWMSTRLIPDAYGWNGYNFEYDFFDGDTIIGKNLCKIWKQLYVNVKSGEEHCNKMYAYEENGKVWFYHQGDTVRRLAYDFHAGVGDSLVLDWTDAYTFGCAAIENRERLKTKIVIRSVEDTVLYGQKQKIFCYSSETFSYKGTWEYHIEGVGSFLYPSLNVYRRFFPGHTSGLFLCKVGEEVLYHNPELEEDQGIPSPTIIKEIIQSSSRKTSTESLKNKCFDLTGRRLTAPPAKGVYIENGKVRVAR